MNMKKKSLKILLTIVMTFVMSLTVAMPHANAARVVPKLQMVTPAAAEYHPGDRVSFTVASPNYGGKVEYRVILYNGTTKKTSELWPNMPGYYYKKWQPAGNYNFTINWVVAGMEPGAYSLTVLVRRVGANVAYDSFIKTNTFWIKAEDQASPIAQETDEQKKALQAIAEQGASALKGDEPKNIIEDAVLLDPNSSEDASTDGEDKLSDIYYENILGKYKIKLPENWIIVEDDDNEENKAKYNSVTLRTYNDSYPYIYIFSGVGVKGLSSIIAKKMVYDSYIKILSEGMESWKEISNKRISISGNDAYWNEYSGITDISGVKTPLNYYMLFTMDNNQMYIICAAAHAEDWENKKSIIEQAMLSMVPLRITSDDSQTSQ